MVASLAARSLAIVIRLYKYDRPDAIPIDLAEQDGTYIIGLWRDADDLYGCVCAYNHCGADGRRGWRPRGYADDGSSEVHPTHWVPVPEGV